MTAMSSNKIERDFMSNEIVQTGGGFLAIIEKASQLDNVDVDKLAKMMEMQLQWEANQAKKSFDAAMTRISAKLATIRIVKTKTVAYDINKNDKAAGQKEAFRYASIEDIDKIVRPILNEENMAVSYDTAPAANSWHEIIVKLSHAGHTETSRIPLPLDTSGGKGNTQAMGSTYSYGKRYALCGALNIITVGEDDDGMGGAITAEQALEIKNGLKETGLDVIKFCQALKTPNIDEIRQKDLARARTALDAKRYQILKKKGAENGNIS